MHRGIRDIREFTGKITGTSTIGQVNLPSSEIAFGSMVNSITGSANFVYYTSNNQLEIYTTANAFTATPSTVELSGSGNITGTFTDAGLTFNNPSNNSTFSASQIIFPSTSNTSSLTNATLTISGGSNIATFSDITATYQTSTSTANISGSGMSVAAGNNTGLFQNNSITFNNLTNDTSYGSSSAKIAGLSPVTSSVLDSGGDLTLTQTNSNVIQLLTTDLTALAITGKTIKIQPVMCQNNSTGLLVTGYFLVGF